MFRRFTAILLAAAAALTLCGCGSVFDAEYVVETSYDPALPPAAAVDDEGGDASVRTVEEIRELLLDMVAAGEDSCRIVFDADYTGDVNADMASACWQARTQDALCAYCVENIAYDISRIVNYHEARVSIRYNAAAEAGENLIRLSYAAEAAEVLREAMEEGRVSLVMLIEYSSYTAESMEEFARRVYHESPAVSPCEPEFAVDMISGAGAQRLYEVSISYPLPVGELAARREALAALTLFDDTDTAALSEAERAQLAFCSLLVLCRCTSDPQRGSIYDALILREANSHGMALAYVELCRRLHLNCELVEGQRDLEEHFWNIVEIDGCFYHADAFVCREEGLGAAYLLSDESAWGSYRWDYFAYPHCGGPLSAGLSGEDAAEPFDTENEISP